MSTSPKKDVEQKKGDNYSVETYKAQPYKGIGVDQIAFLGALYFPYLYYTIYRDFFQFAKYIKLCTFLKRFSLLTL